jgi:putative DNA primase/helicase
VNAALRDPLPGTPADYVRHGWLLVPVPARSKGPRHKGWNERENCITDPARAAALCNNVGIAHAYSGTCSIDFDRLDEATEWLKTRGIDADKLLNNFNAVRISSGRPNRTKLLYQLPSPLPSLKLVDGALEFRCATRSGATVHDLLPPSLHPSGQTYQWEYAEPLIGHWSMLPPIPPNLLELWKSLIAQPSSPSPNPTRAAPGDLQRLDEALAKRDPDSGYDEWVRIGMALHHASGGAEDGFRIWSSWSQRGTKYRGEDDLRPHWDSFSSAPGKTVITAGSILRDDAATADEFVNEETDARPVIYLVGGELHNYAAQCETILADDIYVRERALVRIGGAKELAPEDAGAVRRDDTQAVIIPASVEYLRRRLNQRVGFQAYRRREKAWITTDCPKDLVFNIAGQGEWPTLRRVTTVARAPFARPDGTICETPGYDAASRVFYQPNADFPPVPTNPTRSDAEHALSALLAPFEEFPFATAAARSAFVANILTEVARPAIDTSPAFFYTAPTPGTGKTLLSEMPSRIVHGCGPALRPWAEGTEELRKGLFSSLLAGDRTIGYDNLSNGSKIRSPILCVFLTANVYSDRKLGASESPAIPNRSVVFLTGNNLTPAGDLARRSIVIRLDANTTRLRGRRFLISDLRGYVTEHRPALLVAALTVIRAYTMSSAPGGEAPLPSFEHWSRFASGPLIWLGMADPVTTQDDETEDEAVSLADAFRLIAEHPMMGDKEFMASDLARMCDELISSDDDPLRAVIEAAGCSAPSDQIKVGYWLREKRDHIAGGYKLIRGTATRGARKWKLRRVQC